VGKLIKRRLLDLGLNQQEFAKEIGCSSQYLHLIIYGHRSGNKYIDAIERLLNVNLESYKKTA
jgi:transcriptional regulator with XRE-family HTH domain